VEELLDELDVSEVLDLSEELDLSEPDEVDAAAVSELPEPELLAELFDASRLSLR
jgi:hypothetical protein